jgi:hypothetical protein
MTITSSEQNEIGKVIDDYRSCFDSSIWERVSAGTILRLTPEDHLPGVYRGTNGDTVLFYKTHSGFILSDNIGINRTRYLLNIEEHSNDLDNCYGPSWALLSGVELRLVQS